MLAPEGRKILISLMLLTFGSGIAGYGYEITFLKVLYYVSGVFFVFSLNFFRDPTRLTPEGEGLLISPADGKVVLIDEIEDDTVGPAKQISIFLNVFNVHSNKIPVDGNIDSVDYKEGQFKAAFDHTASDVNERAVVVMSHKQFRLKVKQIAGLIARRIHCYVNTGDSVAAGDRFGFIMFGSRTDLIVPSNSVVNVKVGDKVTGGLTVIGQLPE